MRDQNFEHAKVLVTYWEDGGIEFQEEAKALGHLFSHYFRYDVEYFAIPSSGSDLHLSIAIAECLNKMKEQAEPPLLIMYYGGHADPNDDMHNGGEFQSIWAATAAGGPNVNWSLIQSRLLPSITNADILLLLDCCHAAQAGRALKLGKVRLHILAAAAMRTKTPLPGRQSFTTALIEEVKDALADKGFVAIHTLNTYLCVKYRLYTTPVWLGEDSPLYLRPKPRQLTPQVTRYASSSIHDQGSNVSAVERGQDSGRSHADIDTSTTNKETFQFPCTGIFLFILYTGVLAAAIGVSVSSLSTR